MALLLKQSGESATASGDKVFFWARLKLTLVYVFILALILFGFSAILYQSLQRNLIDASDDNFAGVESHHHFVQNTLADVENEILLIDLTILFVAAGVSYLLAGYTLKPIQRSMEAQKKFSENASHELRTPLAVMKSEAEILLRDPSPTKEQIRRVLESSLEEIDRMTKMTQDLLHLARSENRDVTPGEKVDFSELVRKIADKMKPLAQKQEIGLVVDAEKPLYVVGSRLAFEQIVMNLLQNALQHTPARGSVTLSVKQEKSFAVCTISDTGSGVDEKDLPHIFERFYKGGGTPGSGLGLSIVKELVEGSGGTVSIESIKGNGATATVRLPLAL